MSDPGYSQRYMIQQKFAIPVACLVLALIGLALGVSNRKDGRFASFVLGFGVIFAYYVVLWTVARRRAQRTASGRAWRRGFRTSIFGVAGVALLFWRARFGRSADSHQPSGVLAPRRAEPSTARRPAQRRAARPRRVVLVIRVPHLNLPAPRLLDLYVSRQYLRVFFLGLFSLLGIFYISTFMDLADKLFRGSATTRHDAAVLLSSRRRSSSTTSFRWRRSWRRSSRSA